MEVVHDDRCAQCGKLKQRLVLLWGVDLHDRICRDCLNAALRLLDEAKSKEG